MASGSSGRRTSWTRAKDSDRNETCGILDTALADGQLSMAEHGERVKTATSATTLGQLQDLVSDLQSDQKIDVPVITKIVNRGVPGYRAGWGIKAMEGMTAAGAISAGESLYSEAEIRAGEGYGVYAGLNVPEHAWESSACVQASQRPQGLRSGHWLNVAHAHDEG